MLDKNEVIQIFKRLGVRQKSIILYRILLQRFINRLNENFPNKETYSKVMFFLLLEKSFFLRGKINKLDIDIIGILDNILARTFAFNLSFSRDISLDRDIVQVLLNDFNIEQIIDRIFDQLLENIILLQRENRKDSKTNFLYLEGVSIESMEANPLIQFLYNSQVNNHFIEKLYLAFISIDVQKFEERSMAVHLKYFIEAVSVGLANIDVARVIVLGNGNAGKTSLIKKILDKRYNVTKEKMTPRIEISHQKVGSIEVDYWDFGGQIFMHSTHTFFMTSKATYVIVCNARADEQPDSWLEILKDTLKEGNQIQVLIVYTNVDTKYEIANFNKFRKNILQRKYGNRFDLSFHLHSSRYTDESIFDTLKNKLYDAIKKEGAQKTFKKIKSLYKDAKKTFLRAEDIYNQHKDFIDGDDGTQLIKELLLLGYIFPLKPQKLQEYVYNAEDIFVWQKHWLTYGVYEIINHNITKDKCGYVSKADFKEMLFNGETQYIKKDGSLSNRKSSINKYESITYNDEGIDILYKIVQNYNWAIVNTKRNEELIFPHAVALDEPIDDVFLDYRKESDYSLVITVLMDYVPVGFFFKFVTLAKAHIDEPSLLWRNGVVLFEQEDNKTFAYIEMYQHKMDILINGKNKNYLLKSILDFMARLLRHYGNRHMLTRVMQRVKINGEYDMIDISLMSSILNGSSDSLELIKKALREGGDINIYGDTDLRGSVLGSNGTANNHN